MTVYGIDVSRWQGAALHWDAIDVSGFDFAIAKASEGLSADPTYAVNEPGIDHTTMLAGAYHWLSPGVNQADAADRFVDLSAPDDQRLCALDIEQPGCTMAMVRTWADRFHARTNDHPLFVYIGRNILTALGSPNLSDIGPWWEPYYVTGGYPGDGSAVWTTGRGGWSGPTIWQYGPVAIPGASKRVDGNAFRGTINDLYRIGVGIVVPLAVTSEIPGMVCDVAAGVPLYDLDGKTPITKMSVAQYSIKTPYAAGAFRAIFVTTSGQRRLVMTNKATNIRQVVTPPDPVALTGAFNDGVTAAATAAATAHK